MIDLAVRVQSVNEKGKKFTAPGLGDRIHLLTLAYCVAKAENTFVTLHLSGDKTDGKKEASFKEIFDLFPRNLFTFKVHDYFGDSDSAWISYLRNKGVPAQLFSYDDHLGRFEAREQLDISKYLSNIPTLKAPNIKYKLELPKKYVTCQWDSTAKTRTLVKTARQRVLDHYRNLGYEIVLIGGESHETLFKTNIRNAAYAISNAEYHIGVDSGFMHLAFLYKPFSSIHLYNEPHGFWSHHLLRARDNKCGINVYYKKINWMGNLRIKLVYDSKIAFRLANQNSHIARILHSNNFLKRLFKAKVEEK